MVEFKPFQIARALFGYIEHNAQVLATTLDVSSFSRCNSLLYSNSFWRCISRSIIPLTMEELNFKKFSKTRIISSNTDSQFANQFIVVSVKFLVKNPSSVFFSFFFIRFFCSFIRIKLYFSDNLQSYGHQV